MTAFAINLALAVLTCAAAAGLFYGAMRAAQDPRFYAGVIRLGVEILLPHIKGPDADRRPEWRNDKLTGGERFKRQGGR